MSRESERAVRVAQDKRDRFKTDPDVLTAQSARLAVLDPDKSRAARERVRERESFGRRLEEGFALLAGSDRDTADEVEIDIDD